MPRLGEGPVVLTTTTRCGLGVRTETLNPDINERMWHIVAGWYVGHIALVGRRLLTYLSAILITCAV